MLKVVLGFVVSVVVLLASAYAPLMTLWAYATSANSPGNSSGVLITQIQAGGIGAATQEYIVLYNNSTEDVDISGWCLTNKTNAHIACFNAPGSSYRTYLPAFRHAVIVSAAFGATLPVGAASLTYVPLSQSSGSITGSTDTISLIDHMGTVIDRHSWTTALAAGMQYERHGSGSPLVYQDTDALSDWMVSVPGVLAQNEVQVDMAIVDACLNIEGIQLSPPVDTEIDALGNCVPREIIQLNMSEILPNAIGADTGQEFIEVFNPNTFAVDLSGYALYVGPNFENKYNFPAGSIIEPLAYRSFSNTEIPFTLLNSSGRVGIGLSDSPAIMSETPSYTDPKEGQSWASIDGAWAYTNRPTPGLKNILMAEDSVDIASSSTPQPCAANQFRSPETNRCRLITTVGAAVTACKNGQYRSEETNRCRNIASDVHAVTACDVGEERNLETNRCRKVAVLSVSAACKEGQERNPDTNRCRTAVKMPSAEYGVLGAKAKNGGDWYVFAAVGGVLLLAVGYAIWEWREEIKKFTAGFFRRIRRFARHNK